MKFRKYIAILHEICRNLVNHKHWIGYRYWLLSEFKISANLDSDNWQNISYQCITNNNLVLDSFVLLATFSLMMQDDLCESTLPELLSLHAHSRIIHGQTNTAVAFRHAVCGSISFVSNLHLNHFVFAILTMETSGNVHSLEASLIVSVLYAFI